MDRTARVYLERSELLFLSSVLMDVCQQLEEENGLGEQYDHAKRLFRKFLAEYKATGLPAMHPAAETQPAAAVADPERPGRGMVQPTAAVA